MKSNPKLASNLLQQMSEYVVKGYARKLTDEELKLSFPRTWYLPVFAVSNPNKPGKLRMVWDAAAEVYGRSLNSCLLKGPDQLNSLSKVLYGFRKGSIAVGGEMFHQIGILPTDQHAQRFLWPSASDPTKYDTNGDELNTQLHIFVDASENAFAAVAYLRFEYESHTVCSLVGAKTKVAPKSPTSIPRMELLAATLGSRFAQNICDQHDLQINERIFWSNSKTVLCWLRADPRKFRQFVAFRINEIQENTSKNRMAMDSDG